MPKPAGIRLCDTDGPLALSPRLPGRPRFQRAVDNTLSHKARDKPSYGSREPVLTSVRPTFRRRRAAPGR